MASLQEQYRKGDAAQERVTTQYLPRSGLVLLAEISRKWFPKETFYNEPYLCGVDNK